MNTQLTEKVAIRHSVLTDVDLYSELRLEALKNHPTAFGADYAENLLKPPTYWLERLTIKNDEQALFFAEQNTQLIGMTGIFRSSSSKCRHAAMIWGEYVKPALRGQRVSESLIRACLNWAKHQNIVIVKLAVITSNLSAIRSYERCGFTTYGTEPKAIRYKDAYHNEYLMSIEIGN